MGKQGKSVFIQMLTTERHLSTIIDYRNKKKKKANIWETILNVIVTDFY